MGPLDFHDGTAELRIGKLHYNPAVHTILRYHNQDIIRVVPGEKGEPGKISAIFTNCIGDPILELRENVWIGSLDNWDIQINGQRLTVSQGKRRIALKIRLDPPGKVIIERLDMRIGNAHVIATEDTYTVGRYISESEAVWFHADLRIMKATPFGAVLEFIDPELLEERDIMLRGTGQELATHDRNIVMNSNAGVYVKKLESLFLAYAELFDWVNSHTA